MKLYDQNYLSGDRSEPLDKVRATDELIAVAEMLRDRLGQRSLPPTKDIEEILYYAQKDRVQIERALRNMRHDTFDKVVKELKETAEFDNSN